jgi:hypothetical protein
MRACQGRIGLGIKTQHEEVSMTTCACGNCQFFDTQTKAASVLRKNASGLCRYNPPMPQSDGQSTWPVVANKDWCGHFAATVERFMTAAE